MPKKSLAIIAAVDEGGVIGHQGKIPWNIPEDRVLFHELTAGAAVIMGKVTRQTVPSPLPGRLSFVVDENMSFDEAIAAAKATGRPVFIIGGASIYTQALPLVDTLYISRIPGHHEGDAYFPLIDLTTWQITETRHVADFRLEVYQRS